MKCCFLPVVSCSQAARQPGNLAAGCGEAPKAQQGKHGRTRGDGGGGGVGVGGKEPRRARRAWAAANGQHADAEPGMALPQRCKHPGACLLTFIRQQSGCTASSCGCCSEPGAAAPAVLASAASNSRTRQAKACGGCQARVSWPGQSVPGGGRQQQGCWPVPGTIRAAGTLRTRPWLPSDPAT